jgi:hypothetical protein
MLLRALFLHLLLLPLHQLPLQGLSLPRLLDLVKIPRVEEGERGGGEMEWKIPLGTYGGQEQGERGVCFNSAVEGRRQ